MTRKSQKKLRWGFTTGTAAAAATKAALTMVLSDQAPDQITITLLTGKDIKIAVHNCERVDEDTATCIIIKDAGDDPDVTHKAHIGARVTWKEGQQGCDVKILGGKGVGQVTKPGLEVPPGQAAINPGPQQMIRHAVTQVVEENNICGSVVTEIFVPKGEELARHTLNERLGIIGGISILGTTGVVRPLSHDAYVATIKVGLSVARASGLKSVVFTTGRRSERYAQGVWPEIPAEGFIQIGDYFEKSMQMAAEQGFDEVVLCVFFGKAVKMAQGIPHTHARSARLTLETLSQWTKALTDDVLLAQQVAEANTARHAFDLIKDEHQEVIDKVGREMIQAAQVFGGKDLNVAGVIFGFDGEIKFNANQL